MDRNLFLFSFCNKAIAIIYIAFLGLLLLISCNHKQGITVQEDSVLIENYCSYNTTALDKRELLLEEKTNYDSIIRLTLDLLGIPNSDIQIRQVKKSGAFTWMSRNCRNRSILYNKEFFDSILQVDSSYMALKSICFHEIAHIFYRHPLKSRFEARIHEKQADHFSGYQMRKIGASLEESLVAIKNFGNKEATATHPDLEERIKQITTGFYEAEKLINPDTNFALFGLHSDSEFYVPNEEGALTTAMLKSNGAEVDATPPAPVEESEFYSLLGEIIMIDKADRVFSIADSIEVGHRIRPFPSSQISIIKFEDSSYRIEENKIYPMNALADQVKVGFKLN